MPNRGTQPSSIRHPWARIWVQGWRFELKLTVLSWVTLLLSQAIASWAPYLLIFCAAMVLVFRPDLRHRFSAGAKARAGIRRLQGAMWHCVITGRSGASPQVFEVTQLPVGRKFLLSLPVGLHFELLERRAPELAAALSAREVIVRPVRTNAKLVELFEVRQHPFPKVLLTDLAEITNTDLWKPLPLGLADDGKAVSITLPEHNLLIGGEPGSGKSVALSVLVATAALDPRVGITLFDGKQVELAPWAPVATDFVGADLSRGIEVLEKLAKTMDDRYQRLLAEGRRKIDPSSLYGLHLVVIDELAFYLRGGKKADRDQFAELLRDLISRGRAAGIIVIAATQKPSHEVVPTWIRDLFAYRLAMRCSSSEASDTILGSGWATRGSSASSIDPTDRGVGYLLAEGGTPQLIKVPFLSDEEIATISLRAAKLRNGA